jgi:hypothetical protein
MDVIDGVVVGQLERIGTQVEDLWQAQWLNGV